MRLGKENQINMNKVLVTGATGFVGRSLCQELLLREMDFIAMIRNESSKSKLDCNVQRHAIESNQTNVLDQVHTIIHLAARAHVMHETALDPLAEFRAVNVDATLKLAKDAVKAGVRRFIFVSSIKVNGEETFQTPFTAFDTPNPSDFYGQSKLEAELALKIFAQETGLELVIIRPPLVYGSQVMANFYRLMQITKLGFPLPFANVNNRRSLVSLGNLVDLLITCVTHPAAAHQTFLVSDDDDVSLTRLLQTIAKAMNKNLWLFPVPIKLFQIMAAWIGKSAAINRLFGSLQVDIRHTKQTLNWQPIMSVEQGIQSTVQNFLKSQ
jgi:nucleoside-diphosphate-sugar epimerase